MKGAKLYAGLDTHKDTHTLSVIDEHENVIFEGVFSADGQGYAAIEEKLGGTSVCLRVAIEGTSSYGRGIA